MPSIFVKLTPCDFDIRTNSVIADTSGFPKVILSYDIFPEQEPEPYLILITTFVTLYVDEFL